VSKHFIVSKDADFLTFYFSINRGHPDPEKWPSHTVNPKNGLFVVDENEETSFVLSQFSPKQEYFLKVSMHIRDSDADKVRINSNC